MVKLFRIPHFRGVFMRDTLPKKADIKECGILNLDSVKGSGTHWTCWFRNSKICYYFDSFGLAPPLEFEKYINSDLCWSTYKLQQEGDVICGHLCLIVLFFLLKQKLKFNHILLSYKNERC